MAACMKRIITILVALIFFLAANAQVNVLNFRHVTNADGLSDGVVRSITQDKYGFIWFGTSYGLDRFDGINLKTFFSKPGDPHSLGNNYIQSLYCDEKNILWIGTYSGLCHYDYSSNQFTRYSSTSPVTINDIKEDRKGNIWLATSWGLWTVDKKNLSIRKYDFHGDVNMQKKFETVYSQVVVGKDNKLYIASYNGIKIFDPEKNVCVEMKHNPADKFSISDNNVYSVSIDSSGDLWAACGNEKPRLNKINLRTGEVKFYDHFDKLSNDGAQNVLQKILTDHKGRIWIITGRSGISLYDTAIDDFIDYMRQPYIPNSLSSNQHNAIFQDVEGTIWLGTAGYGINYFNPDRNFFSSIYPLLEKGTEITNTWCRAACEDDQGNLWLATGKGAIRYDSSLHSFTNFTNAKGKNPSIYLNSVRSLLKDDNGDIWIGTAKGLNRYHPLTGKMDSFDEKDGMPLAFFWMMAKDKQNDIWLGSTWGLYKYDREKNKFDDLSKDPVLAKYAHRNVQALWVDSKNRLWIGLLDMGLVMYDLNNKKLKLLTIKDSLISDTRFSSFAEDKEGIIWIGAEQGLAAYDPEKNITRFITRENGLPSDRTNNIMVDSFDRVWIGTSNGLCLLSRDRTRIKKFDTNDGLLTTQFNEQSAYRTKNGLFIYPTYKGFILFRPEDYKETSSNIPVYITSFKIADKEIPANTESLQNMDLRHNQNFFKIELAGLNYMNAYQCTYAYKLEPFDKDWIYTKKREINYTNVPAGEYVFRYKLVGDNPAVTQPEKQMAITISEIFYKTWWFRSLVLVLIAAAIIGFYRYRLGQREKILVLENKAQLLEKEKAVVQFENLKQQLNPHFLFNSLTSLRSLIRVDGKSAVNFLDGLSTTYRYLLKSDENELVSLEDELNFVKTFSQLQKTRFKEGLKLNFCIDPVYYDKLIAPVTLQNLIENAIKHNTTDEESPLVIDMYIEDGYIAVRNNLQRYRIVETSNKRGLASMRSLYKYFSDKPLIVSEEEKYFIVKIPLI